MFFNASDLTFSWFTKGCHSDTISFYPNQINFLSPTIKENKVLIYLFCYGEIAFGLFQENLDLNYFVPLNTIALTIFDNKFMENLKWLDIKTTSDIPITIFFLIDEKLVLGTNTFTGKTFGMIENSGHVKCGLYE